MSGPVIVEHGVARAELHHGDCLAGMRSRLADGSVDVVVTSPPYNIGVKYGAYRDDRPRADYLAWIETVGIEIARVLKPTGSFFLNVGNRPVDPWIAWDVVSRLRERFHLQNVIHWIKAISIARADAGPMSGLREDLSVGHYKPVNSGRFLNDAHEFVFHLTPTGEVPLDRLSIGVPYQDKSNIARWEHTGKRDLRCRGNVWFVPYETIQRRDTDRPHPATFPAKLAEMCLRLHGAVPTSLALDPFVGLGSTPLAALRVGCRSIGFDLDADYLAVAEKRLREEIARPR